jgi:hypothetical protein
VPDLEWMPVTLLARLPQTSVARPLDPSVARRLALRWTHEDDYWIIHVSLHVDRPHVVVDGAHHVAAAVLAECICLPAAVYEHLDSELEAALHVLLNP